MSSNSIKENKMAHINTGMRQLIRLVNRLQDVPSTLGIQLSLDLPQIAVVGGQSAGKSSVLENFLGRDFLPRGTGIVTRRPLVLQLINSNEEYAEFLHKPEEKFYDFKKVQKEIENETIRVTGRKKGISSQPINLRAYSPNVLNLTLIDLPGMTKIAVDDQPKDIDIQIKSMVLEYISKPSCLILAVTPANTDLANSDALQIAREVDQQGVRTIGVLTKLDLMDKGTDAREVLENKLLPLKRGYVGVINRSQRDLDSQKDIQSQINEERKFFIEHPAYKHMAHRMGTLYLQQTLNQQLTEHIKHCLPNLKNTLRKQLGQLDQELADYDLNCNEDESATKAKLLLRLIQSFTTDYETSLEGSRSSEIDTEELSGGARIRKIYHKHFPAELAEIQFNEMDLRKEIAIAIRNIHGIRNGLFTPDLAFDAVMKKQIVKLKQPCFNCIDLVCTELSNIITNSIANKMFYYPNLTKTVQEVLSNQIEVVQQKCKDQVDLYINIQLSYMNMNHEDFVGVIPEYGNKSIIGRLTNHPGKSIMIKSGLMYITNSSFMKGDKMLWFALTSEKLSWYRDNTQKEFINSLTFDGIQLKESESKSFMSKKQGFSLININGKPIYKDNKQLDLRCESTEEEESWKIAFSRAGIFQEKTFKIYESDDNASSTENLSDQDPQLKKQVETIRNLVINYRHIVNKSTKDLLPKMITYIVLNSMNKFIHSDLIVEMYNVKNQNDLLEESDEEKSKRQEKIKAYTAYKAALSIIAECSLTISSNVKLANQNRDSSVNATSPISRFPQKAVSFSTIARPAPRPPPLPPKPI